MMHPAIRALEEEMAKAVKLRDDAAQKAATAHTSAQAWEEAVPRHQTHVQQLAEALILLKKGLTEWEARR